MPAQILFCFNPDYALLADSFALHSLVQKIYEDILSVKS